MLAILNCSFPDGDENLFGLSAALSCRLGIENHKDYIYMYMHASEPNWTLFPFNPVPRGEDGGGSTLSKPFSNHHHRLHISARHANI